MSKQQPLIKIEEPYTAAPDICSSCSMLLLLLLLWEQLLLDAAEAAKQLLFSPAAAASADLEQLPVKAGTVAKLPRAATL